MHKIYILQTLCTTKHAVSTFGRENRFRRTEVLVENDKEQFTISDLVGKMQEYLEGTGKPLYRAVYMKRKLQEHFGEKIMIITVNN